MEAEPYPHALVEILSGFALVVVLFGAVAVVGVMARHGWDVTLKLAVAGGVAASTGLLWAGFRATALVVTYLWRVQYCATSGVQERL